MAEPLSERDRMVGRLLRHVNNLAARLNGGVPDVELEGAASQAVLKMLRRLPHMDEQDCFAYAEVHVRGRILDAICRRAKAAERYAPLPEDVPGPLDGDFDAIEALIDQLPEDDRDTARAMVWGAGDGDHLTRDDVHNSDVKRVRRHLRRILEDAA